MHQGLDAYEAAVALHNLGSPGVLDSLGYAYHQLGRFPEAIDCIRRSRDMYREMGNRYGESVIATHLGDAYQDSGNPTAAHDSWQHALDLLEQLDHPDAAQLHAKLRSLAGSG